MSASAFARGSVAFGLLALAASVVAASVAHAQGVAAEAGGLPAWLGAAVPGDLPLALVLVAVAAWTASLLAERAGFPSALGALVAGAAAGALVPSLAAGAGALGEPGSGVPGLGVLAAAGFVALMLHAGIDGARGEGPRGAGALVFALGALVVPQALTLALGVVGIGAWGDLGVAWTGGTAGGLGVVALAAAAGVAGARAATPARTVLLDSIVLALLAFWTGGWAESAGPDANGLAHPLVRVLAFLAALVLALYGLRRMKPRLRGMGRATLFTFALVVAGTFAAAAVLAGFPAGWGALVAGGALARVLRGSPLAGALGDLTRHAGAGVAGALFFAYAGTLARLDGTALALGAAFGLVAAAGRLGGGALAGRLAGMPARDALGAAAGLVPRGAVAAFVLVSGLAAGVLAPGMYAAGLVGVALTLALDPFLRRLWPAPGEAARTPAGAERTGVVIVGAGPLARRVAGLLTGEVTLVDRNERNCAQARAEGLRVRCASALDADVLRDAGTAQACYFLTLTPNAGLNVLVADIARGTFGVPIVLTPDLGGRATASGTDSVLFGDGFGLEDWDYHAAGDRVRVEEVVREPGRPVVPTAERLPVALRRGERVLPYSRALGVEDGDVVVTLVRTGPDADPNRDRFDALVRTCPVLDLGPESFPMVMFFDRVGAALAPRLALDPDRIATLLLQREADAGTVVLPGLAIPHVVVPGEGHFELVIARVQPGGVLFPEQTPVHAAFVLVSTADERGFHLRALASIAHAVQRDEFDAAWRAAPDADALRALVLAR